MKQFLLVSIRPEFANKIFDGTKTVELRRLRPRVEPGDRVLVYVSAPVMALAGSFEVDGVEESEPETFWPAVRERAGISKAQFDSYYEGADRAYAIGVRSVRRLSMVPLSRLRRMFANFHPPQGYRYLTAEQARRIW